jgi:hypothetical protein
MAPVVSQKIVIAFCSLVIFTIMRFEIPKFLRILDVDTRYEVIAPGFGFVSKSIRFWLLFHLASSIYMVTIIVGRIIDAQIDQNIMTHIQQKPQYNKYKTIQTMKKIEQYSKVMKCFIFHSIWSFLIIENNKILVWLPENVASMINIGLVIILTVILIATRFPTSIRQELRRMSNYILPDFLIKKVGVYKQWFMNGGDINYQKNLFLLYLFVITLPIWGNIHWYITSLEFTLVNLSATIFMLYVVYEYFIQRTSIDRFAIKGINEDVGMTLMMKLSYNNENDTLYVIRENETVNLVANNDEKQM